ncbi:MAG: hypothetical protein ONB46_23145 [candidate division KSB1 bacterium]|nr:hypothetical protein [candidate division KSB1 bacterium]MDZ7368684.1 hypothetical protein [candidate division KSB1 bacterium]MDZ7406575.1 hypothetical protein [candidate division KSB1 bacterium]
MCRSVYQLKIKRAVVMLAILGAAALLSVCSKEPVQKKTNSTAPTEVLIKFKPGVPEDSVKALANRLGLEQVGELSEIGVRIFRANSPGVSIEQALRSCQSSPHIEYAEPNSKVQIPEKD